MSDHITAKQAAEICNVNINQFRSARKGIGAPDPVINDRIQNQQTGQFRMTVLYSREQYVEWAKSNNFWEMAARYRQFQRTGVYDTERTIKTRKTKKIKKISELDLYWKTVTLKPELKNMLIGRYAPAPVLISQDMKLLRAKLNKPKTLKVRWNYDYER